MIRSTSLPWTVGAAIGTAGTALVTLCFWLLPAWIPPEVPALVALVPITAASVLSGWRVGLPLAICGALVHSWVFVHPVGTVTFGYTQDIAVLVTFAAVAVVVSVLVSRRSLANQAELIGRERMVLLRSVSHDLRNPLHTVLAASTELLDGGDHDDATRRRLLGLIVDETERLDRIVTNLLGMSRLQAGALVPTRQPESLLEVVVRCVDRFARLEHQVTIDVSGVPDIDVDVDAVQIDQVLTNLIENAIRHAPGSSVVVVEGAIDRQAAPPHVTVSVVDEGPGFPSRSRFSPPRAFASTDGSWGLGLTVCEAIVTAHGGALVIDGRANTGARVSFSVPLAG